MKAHLNLQVCVYPFFDGGFYVSGPTKYMLQIRVSLGVIDFRIWWDSMRVLKNVPRNHIGPVVEVPAGFQPAELQSAMVADIVHGVCAARSEGFEIAENEDKSLILFQREEDASRKAAELGSEWEPGRLALIPASKLPLNWSTR